MNRKGFFKGNQILIPNSLEAYELSKAKYKSLYLDSEEYADIVNYYTSMKLYNEAKEAVNDAKSIHLNNTKILLEEAYLYLEENEVEKAYAVTSEIVDQDDYEVLLLRADIALQKSEFSKARGILNLIENKDNLDSISDVVYLYIDYKQFDDAYMWLQSGMDKYQDEEEYILARADYYLASNQYAEACDAFDQLLNIDPYSALYWWGQARALFELSKFIECIDACEFGTVVDDEFVDLHILQGQAFQQINMYYQAISPFQKALDLQCADTDIVNLLLKQSKEEVEKEIIVHRKQFKEKAKADDSLLKILYSDDMIQQLFKHLEAGEIQPAKHCSYIPTCISSLLQQAQRIKKERDFEEREFEYMDFTDEDSRWMSHMFMRDEYIFNKTQNALQSFLEDDRESAYEILKSAEGKAMADNHISWISDVYIAMGDNDIALQLLTDLFKRKECEDIYKIKIGYIHLLNEDLEQVNKINIELNLDEDNKVCIKNIEKASENMRLNHESRFAIMLKNHYKI